MFGTRIHHTSAHFRGPAGAALDVGRVALMSLGFEIKRFSDDELRAVGPGLRSTQQPALLGVSELRIRVGSSRIEAKATLGGAARLKRFVYLFPPLLMLVLFLVNVLAGNGASWLYAALVAPWVVLGPLIGWSIERRTSGAVDSLVRSMAQPKSA